MIFQIFKEYPQKIFICTAIPETLFPLVSAEITDYDLNRAIQNGTIPRHYAVKNAKNRIKAYIDLYLKEEIKEDVTHILFDATGHTPIVIPVINKV